MTGLAITDHGVLFGVVEFYQMARKHGIKPIIGCEVYVARRTRFDRTPHVDDDLYHLVLLAENEEGYRNLLKVSSAGFLEGFYYKPRVDKDLLRRHNRGIVALSGCLAGEVPRRAAEGHFEKAKEAAREYNDIFGSGNFFLEIQKNGIPEQRVANEALVRISKELSIPVVATNDVHYINREDAPMHDVLLCIQTGKTVEDEDRLRFPTDEFFFKSSEQMWNEFQDVPEALENAVGLAERCQVELSFGQPHVPHYEVPTGYDVDTYLEALCREGLAERYTTITGEVEERLQYELGVIRKMGYCGYFLIVWDFVKYARESGIFVGPGRGSAPGSIVAYALGITSLDPLKYGLFFERFLNPERVSMPDIDIDFCFERRNEVIDYVVRKYGEENVAQIITFGTMAARASIRDVGRALNFPYSEVDKIAKLVPFELGTTIERALGVVPELKGLYENGERVKLLIDMAKAVEGMPRHASVHAAGVVISRDSLTDHVPLYKTSEGVVTTQYPMETLEELGLLKIDFLGLRTLTLIRHAIEIIRKTRGEIVDIDRIRLDDPEVYEMLARADSLGVFQLESSLFQGLLKDVKPTKFEDLIAILALGRPGPMGRIQDFARQKHGLQPIEYPHLRLEAVLKETYGIMLYQEQVMQVGNELAGFSLGEADLMRRAMGKKKPEVLAGLKAKFLAGAEKNGVDRMTSERIFELVEYFSGYGFNKSHSAAYALISYQMAYLKAHYPVEFMAALLTNVMGANEKVALYVDGCRQKGIKVLPPDVNESLSNFTVVRDGIRFGLAAVKNVGKGAVEAIIKAGTDGRQFSSLLDFCERVDLGAVPKKATESLVKCGAFDSLGCRRSQLLAVLDRAYDLAGSGQKERARGQTSFFDLFEEKSAFAKADIELPDIEEFSARERLAMEKDLLGLYVSGHPLTPVAPKLREETTVTTVGLSELSDGAPVVLGGIITGYRRMVTKSGQTMAFLQLEDLMGTVEVIVFPKVLEEYSQFIAEDEVVLVEGRVDVKEEETKAICQGVVPLARGNVRIQIVGLKTSKRSLMKLREALRSHGGQTPVFIHAMTSQGRAVLSTPPDLWVTYDANLARRVEEVLGRGSCIFENDWGHE